MNLVERVQKARQKFIHYYNKGKSDTKWHRPIYIYMMWAFEDESGKCDWVAFEIWEYMRSQNPGRPFSTFDDVMSDFDMTEKYAKLWAFS